MREWPGIFIAPCILPHHKEAHALFAVDAALCSRSCVCSSIAPQIFASERDQATTVLRSTIRYGDVEVAQEAEAECPARAITVEIVDA